MQFKPLFILFAFIALVGGVFQIALAEEDLNLDDFILAEPAFDEPLEQENQESKQQNPEQHKKEDVEKQKVKKVNEVKKDSDESVNLEDFLLDDSIFGGELAQQKQEIEVAKPKTAILKSEGLAEEEIEAGINKMKAQVDDAEERNEAVSFKNGVRVHRDSDYDSGVSTKNILANNGREVVGDKSISSPIFKKPNAEMLYFKKPNYVAPIIENIRQEQPSLISIVEDDFDFLDAEYIQKNAGFDSISALNGKKINTEAVETVEIEKGQFNNPFYDELKPYSPGETSEDLSLIEEGAEIVQKQKVHKIEEQNFYLKERGLKVEIKQDSSDKDSLFKNAFAAMQAGQYESAVAYYEKIISINPKNTKAVLGAATAFHYLKDYAMSKSYYKNLIRMDPNNFKAVNNYILLLIEESPKQAKERLLTLWVKNQKFAPIPGHLGNLSFDEGDYNNAAKFYLKAVELDRNNYKYMNNLAVALEMLGDSKSAVSVYKKLYEVSAKGVYKPEKAEFFRGKLFTLMSDG